MAVMSIAFKNLVLFDIASYVHSQMWEVYFFYLLLDVLSDVNILRQEWL